MTIIFFLQRIELTSERQFSMQKKPIFVPMLTFTAIDFELATADYNSICAVGIVSVVEGVIVNEFFSLIKPPNNKYMWQTTRVHGVKSKHTATAPSFEEVYPSIFPLLFGQEIIAHNEKFDRSVLKETMKLYNLNFKDLKIKDSWTCTSKIYQEIGFAKTKLSFCCEVMGIPLKHHDPLSDAKATAVLYLNRSSAPERLLALEQ